MTIVDRIMHADLPQSERWELSKNAGKDPHDEERKAGEIVSFPLFWQGNLMGFLDTDSLFIGDDGNVYVLQNDQTLYRIDRRLFFWEKWTKIGTRR